MIDKYKTILIQLFILFDFTKLFVYGAYTGLKRYIAFQGITK